MTKFIFVTGGVTSSVGKGIAVASLGRILKSHGLHIALMKLDPYLNVDPGTMSPYQHGEVFVTDDGAETDLDLGHYERFTSENVSVMSNTTTGQVYASVIAKERKGEYLGNCIQVVPHVTNEIKARIKHVAEHSRADIVIVEVGGTVGDIEGEPFLEAIRQMKRDAGAQNVCYVHLTLLPYLQATQELKTKPTQHSVKELLRFGIQPDLLLCRCDRTVPQDTLEKIASFCNVETKAVIPLETLETIYEVPLLLESYGVATYLLDVLHLPSPHAPQVTTWSELVSTIKHTSATLPIALVGKYVELHDAYLSVAEALRHAGWYHEVHVDIRWIDSELLEREDIDSSSLFADVAGILVPGGFGQRGIAGKIATARLAREGNIPYLGICLGMQVAVIEYARNVLGLSDADSTEFSMITTNPVISLLPDQQKHAEKGGTMRLGQYPCTLVPDTKAEQAYATTTISERHRHRYEFNTLYKSEIEAHGMRVSGHSPDGRLVEIIELVEHPWFVASQFHPEFKSRPDAPHPLFREFIKASLRHHAEHAQSHRVKQEVPVTLRY